jgi:hypothetical protein
MKSLKLSEEQTVRILQVRQRARESGKTLPQARR